MTVVTRRIIDHLAVAAVTQHPGSSFGWLGDLSDASHRAPHRLRSEASR